MLNSLATANNYNVILIGVLLITVVVSLVYIFYQSRKISRLELALKPKYGFLGKPLLAAFMVFMLVGVAGVTLFNRNNVPDDSVGGQDQFTVDIQAGVSTVTAEGVIVDFRAVPYIDGIAWGGSDTAAFDMFWSINGPVSLSQFELGLTRLKPGGFFNQLPRGSYDVKVVVTYQGVSTFAEKTFSFR